MQLPALYLRPVATDSSNLKYISFLPQERVTIGRYCEQSSNETAPTERNGRYESKVLSRRHAEVWQESDKIFIKDTGSKNGTYVNGKRLSPGDFESEPLELKSEDSVVFGIDVFGDDGKTCIHRKTAVTVFCVYNDEDATRIA